MPHNLQMIETLSLEQHTLGESAHELSLSLKEENRILSEHMASQARRNISILTRDLDKAVYDNDEFINACSRLARLSKFTEIFILVKNSTPAIKSNHRLIDLYRKLSSSIKIRKTHEDYDEYNESFMVVDQRGVIFRQQADRYEANAYYNAPLLAQKLLKTFSEIWGKSSEDPQLRRLYI